MKTKRCSKCLEAKPISDFRFSKKQNYYRGECIQCEGAYYVQNKEKIIQQGKEYRLANKDKIKQQQADYYNLTKQEKRWLLHLKKIKERCSGNDKFDSYTVKGIQNYLTEEDIKYLWIRDKAWLLVEPSIDRKENNGHYTVENCRFIEMVENRAKGDKSLEEFKKIAVVEDINGKKRVVLQNITPKPIYQLDLQGNLIKKWVNSRIAAKELNLSPSKINDCLSGKTKEAYGFVWRFAQEELY